MAKKDALFGYLLVDDESLATSFDSEPFRLKYLDNVGISIDCTGVTTNSGYFTVEHRIVKDDNQRSFSSWCPLEFDSGNPTLASADNTFKLNINQIWPGELRVRFFGSGDGVCKVWLTATSLGG